MEKIVSLAIRGHKDEVKIVFDAGVKKTYEVWVDGRLFGRRSAWPLNAENKPVSVKSFLKDKKAWFTEFHLREEEAKTKKFIKRTSRSK
jgi:hypothetical protein